MDKTSCFAFEHYRDYLEMRLSTKGPQRGLRSRLAEELSCQSAYISRVLAGESHFSLEHAVLISRFLGHSALEKEYFLLLVHEARAGNQGLRDFYKEKREEVQKKRQVIAERIHVKQTLSREDQMTYYSAWFYAAIHVMLTIEKFRTPESITKYLQLPLAQVQQVLEFLETTGLARHENGAYMSGEARIHLGKDSPMLPKHHANWRMRAIQVMDRYATDDLFFSGPISVSEKNAEKIRGKVLKLIEDIEPLLKETDEEAVFCLDMDFFRL